MNILLKVTRPVMNYASFFCVLCFVFSLVGCNNKNDKNINANRLAKGDVNNISIINLISTPQNYDGKKIRIKGFLNLGFESNALYLHEEDYELKISVNAIWIELPEQQFSKFKKFDNKYVIIEGVFDASNKGHMSSFSGTVSSLSRLELVKTNGKL